MAVKSEKTPVAKKDREVIPVNARYGISSVRVNKNGRIYFTLDFEGVISIYNCGLGTTSEGNYFISPPSKQENGKWYNLAYIDIPEDDSDAIITAVIAEAKKGV